MPKKKPGLDPDHRMSDLLRVPPGPVDLHLADTRSTPGFNGDKAAAAELMPVCGERLATLQEQLYAEGRTGGTRSMLLVLQGLDTSGKGGTVRHVVGHADPSGLQVTGFGRPTREELEHDFLWRIRRRLPAPGTIGVFDRSHYEDVVAVRVRRTVERRTWSRRYAAINRFEEKLVARGTRVVKCFLHISPEEQRKRLLARFDDPTKHWKIDPGDLDDRELWNEYLDAYGDALERCNTELAPWYVIPADRKWYRNLAITQLLVEHLEEMGLRWPEPPFDVDALRERLASMP